MSIHLSRRLQAVAELVPPNAHVIDVGTDHALVPVWLAQTGRAAHVWASDLREGPLKGAQRLIDETDTGHIVELRRTDGLCGFTAADGDTVVIAGMGGETMAAILTAAEWTRENTLLILEPQSKQAELRRFLVGNGYCIHRERLVKDAGRLYPILTAGGGASPAYTDAEMHTGLFCQIAGEPLFGEYLATLKKRAVAAAPYDENAAALWRAYQTMEERWISCRT